MRGDFTRSTFDRSKRFSRVLKQQGRVELDSDFNEAMDILLHHQRTVASDLIGQHGTPPVTDETEGGFHIYMNDPAGEDFSIGRGKYYVDGILCENDGRKNADGNLVDFTYLTQPDYPQAPALPNVPFIVYLDVWERHITALEDDYIREKALNGPDTASRAKVVWQVKVANRLSEEESLSNEDTCESSKERWSEWVRSWRSENRGLLKAATGDPSDADLDNPCITPPEARYRGAENQLYRVEIHTSGTMGDATFKWSRDNGSMIFPVVNRSGGDITLGYLGRDSRHSIEPGQWVELVDDNLALHGEGRPLGKVMAVDRERMMVTVEWPENPDLPDYANEEEYKSKHVLLRRWDHTDRESVPGQPGFDAATGTLFIAESENPDSDNWLTLENGIRISFAKSAGEYHDYQTGDYWLIPARIATGDVEWPWERDPSGDVVMSNNRPVPEKRPPHGVEHHYAPLAVIPIGTADAQDDRYDCRRKVTSVIGPDTDVQVHNLDIRGNLNVAGTVNGRDVSADASAFATHIARTDNPHGTTAAQVGALSTAGGTVSGSLAVSGGRLDIQNSLGNRWYGAFIWHGHPQASWGLLASVTPTLSSMPGARFAAVAGVADLDGVHGVYARAKSNTHALYVEGTSLFTGLKTGYVADIFVNMSGQRLRTGDVVKLKGGPVTRFQGDNNKIPVAEVTLADKENDNAVIGIVDREAIPDQDGPDIRVSPEDPTFIESGGELFVVTLGTYAHCRVDATEAPIEVGDLLTSSRNPGCAKKATNPQIGSIIGKALEPLAQGTGYIAVFVNIQ